MVKIHHDNSDLEYMRPVLAASKRQESRAAVFLLYFSIAFIVLFIIWAMFAEIDEVTRGEGRVIPSSRIQTINHLEGGIVKEILVNEGDRVEKDQILLRIDNTVADALVAENRELYLRYLAAQSRLLAQIHGTPFVVPERVTAEAPRIAKEEQFRFNSRNEDKEKALNIAQHGIEQKEQEILEQESRKENLTEQLALIKEEVDINEPLMKKGLASKVDYLRLKREQSDLQGKLFGTQISIQKLRSELEEAKEKLAQIPVTFREDDIEELRTVESRLPTFQGSFRTEGDRLTRTEVRSPVKGIIKQIMRSTIGSVVRAGEDVIEIVRVKVKSCVWRSLGGAP